MSAIPIRRDLVFVAVYVFLERDGKVLALERANTGYMDGYWCPPAGGVDEGEAASDCAVRECLEEVGVQVAPSSLALVHTLHRKTDQRRVIDLFSRAEVTGEPVNAEPHKCAQLAWVDLESFDAWMPYIPRAMALAGQGIPYSEAGFTPR